MVASLAKPKGSERKKKKKKIPDKGGLYFEDLEILLEIFLIRARSRQHNGNKLDKRSQCEKKL
jgi:hypothetical protein